MSLGVPKPKPYPRYRVLNHVSIISIPKLDFHPHTHNFHTNIHSSLYPYSNSILKFSSSIHPYFHTFLYKNPSSIPVIFSFLFLLSSFLFSSSSSSSFLFSSLLSVFALSFFKTKMRLFILVLSLFVLIPFLFHFPRRKLPPSFLQATCLFHNFSSLFHYNIFLLLPFGPHFHFYSHSIYQNPTLTYKLIKL